MRTGPTVCIALLLGGVTFALALCAPTAHARPSARPALPAHVARAESLYRAVPMGPPPGTIEERRVALRDLEEAVARASDDPRLLLALGNAELTAGFTTRAAACYEKAARLAPRDAAPRLGLALAAKRDWLAYLEPSSLVRATDSLIAAVRLDPSLCDAWVTLAPLLYECGDERRAVAAAWHAVDTGPGRADAQLAAAYLEYRHGQTARAESLFILAIPRLAPDVRARFYDLRPLVGDEDADLLRDMSPAERIEYERRFWSVVDPDPGTPENESRLEFWARVAHASLVYLDPVEPRWDARAELYVRYGRPGRAGYDPVTVETTQLKGKVYYFRDRHGVLRTIGAQIPFPIHAQIIDYPDLGMSVQLDDITLSGRFAVPGSLYGSNDPRPDPRALERGNLLATAGGRALFPLLPPHARALAVDGCVLRFEGATGARLLAQIEAPGTPVDSVWAQCVVTDSSEHVIARAARELTPSGCDPTELRTGDFTFDVPPGVYRVAFSVRDGHGARGVARATRVVGPAPAGLAMSDRVVVCGPVGAARAVPEIRLGPNLKARVAGAGPLIAYFELYHMAPDAGGQARFEYEYAVRSEDKDARPWYRRLLPFGDSRRHYAVKSEDTNVGPLRRQFITVPVRDLGPGHYRLDVRVRDLATGAVTTGTARFERVGAGPAGG